MTIQILQDEMKIAVLLLLVAPGCVSQEYSLGFMLNEKDESYLPIFKKMIAYAINKANTNSTGIKFKYEWEEYDGTSLYEVVNASCSLLSKDVMMVISPDISNNIAIQADVFNNVKMPLIASSATDSYLKTAGRNELFVMAPSDLIQAQVVVDLLTKYSWTKLSLIASDSNYGIHGATTLQQLLIETTAEVTVQEEFDASVYFFEAVSDPADMDLRDILKNVVESLDRVFVLHCEDYYGKYVLQKAQRAGLLRKDFVWIVTESVVSSPQALKQPLSDSDPTLHFPSYYEGLIGISLYVDTQNSLYTTFKDDVRLAGQINPRDMTPVVVMLYDAIMLAIKSIQDNSNKMMGVKGTVAGAKCGNKKWESGKDVARFLKNTEYNGVSGSYSFTHDHTTDNSQYRIVNFIDPGPGLESGFYGKGTWSTSTGLKIKDTEVFQYLGGVMEIPRGIADTLVGQHLKVGVTRAPPFAIKGSPDCNGIECWTGICPEIVARLAKDLEFTYEFIEPDDGKYGHFTETEGTTQGVWDGMIGDLLKNRIDIIAMDLSVSSQRRSYIDFTFSYLDTGISVVMKGESRTDQDRFFFLSPFAFSTWAVIVLAIVTISVFQTVLGKLSPYDQHGIMAFAAKSCTCEKCDLPKIEGNPEGNKKAKRCLSLEAQKELNSDSISLNNALWVVGGGFVGQGGEPLPRSPSGRMILLTWWFFVMLITNMYGANLTAFMTLDKQGVPIKKASDLLTQTTYRWGVQHNSITAVLLENHIVEENRQLGNLSENVLSFGEGIEEVKAGEFALIEDTLWLEYDISTQCDIFFVGEKLLTIPVAFGLPINSPYARLFNKQILLYREEGFFQRLWSDHGRRIEERKCDKGGVGNDKSLDIRTLIGIFYVLLIGMLVSAALLLLEVFVATIQDGSFDSKVTFREKLKKRLMLAFAPTSFERKRRGRRKKQTIFSPVSENGRGPCQIAEKNV